MPTGGAAAEDWQLEQLSRAGRCGSHRRDDGRVGQDSAGRDVAAAGHRVAHLPQRAHPAQLAARAQPVDSGGAPPRIDARPGRGGAQGSGELFVGPGQLVLRAQLSLNAVPQLHEYLDVERGVGQPGLGQRAGGPVGCAVPLFQPDAQQVLHKCAEPDPLVAGQSGPQLRVEDARRHHRQLRQTGQVLGCRVQHPLVVLQGCRQLGQVGAADRVDECRARAGPPQLHQIGALGVAVTRRPLGVDSDRPVPGCEPADDVGQRPTVLRDGRDTVARAEQKLGFGAGLRSRAHGGGNVRLVTRPGHLHHLSVRGPAAYRPPPRRTRRQRPLPVPPGGGGA